MLKRLGELKAEAPEVNRDRSQGDRLLMGGKLLGRALFVVLNHAFQRGVVQLQFGIPEEFVTLLDFFSPGELWKRIGRGVRMTTGAAELMNLLGAGFRGQPRHRYFKRFRRRGPIFGKDN